jgi:hypothetical protein
VDGLTVTVTVGIRRQRAVRGDEVQHVGAGLAEDGRRAGGTSELPNVAVAMPGPLIWLHVKRERDLRIGVC